MKSKRIVGILTIVLVGVFAIWALLSLYSIKSGSIFLKNVCIAQSGYSCSNTSIDNNGFLSFYFKENTGLSLYNVKLSCISANVTPLAKEYVNISSLKQTNGTLNTGQLVKILGLQCYGTNGLPFNNNGTTEPIGTTFTGYLWINYTVNPEPMGFKNPSYIYKTAQLLDLKVT